MITNIVAISVFVGIISLIAYFVINSPSPSDINEAWHRDCKEARRKHKKDNN